MGEVRSGGIISALYRFGSERDSSPQRISSSYNSRFFRTITYPLIICYYAG